MPSFWVTLTKGSGASEKKEADEGAKTAKKAVSLVVGSAAGSTVYEKAVGEQVVKKADNALKKSLNKMRDTKIPAYKRKAANKAFLKKLTGGQLKGQSGQYVAKAGVKATAKAAGKSIMKIARAGFRNFIPCLPAALIAWLDGGATFFTCMGNCLAAALGIHIAKFVFNLVKNCLWDIIKNALAKVCFPADASLQLSDGRTVTMEQLRVGDKVMTSDGTFSDVYVMSHQEADILAEFVQLKGQTYVVEATAKHFLIVSPQCDEQFKTLRAQDIQVGMCLFTVPAGTVSVPPSILQPVTEKTLVHKRGIYNPFTLEGSLMVNGVAASSHSDWFLDDIAEYMGVTHLLPAVYQAVLAPARGLYQLVGPEIARRELEEYRTEMAFATENNLVVKPYLDLIIRAVKVLWN